MFLSSTLLIKHLPNVLSENEKEDFLRHFGAVEVKCISSKQNKYNLAFARFPNENIAENVMHRLHQINFLGSRLTVEFAENENINCPPPKQSFNSDSTKEDEENEKFYKQFIKKLTSWYSSVNFTQPVPSHLKYQYPPPDMQTLVNIIKVLATVPKFYTQVLHLMNKMNLPCPFGRDILPHIKLPFYSADEGVADEQDLEKRPEELLETSESEISSDEETKNLQETIPQQYKIKKKTKIKVPKFFKPVLGPTEKKKKKKTKFEEVFEKVSDETEPKKIKLAQSIPVVEPSVKLTEEDSSKIVKESDQSGFGFIHPVKKPTEAEPPKDIRDEREEERLEKEQIVCISENELSGNRMSEKDRSVLPVFKNYAEGAPTCRLYIKNLAKTVTDQDLRYIYNRYLAKSFGDEPNMFDIRLMQEGRMKGQAFVTFQSVELAQKALKETNGYILKDKPLVVQFARSATK